MVAEEEDLIKQLVKVQLGMVFLEDQEVELLTILLLLLELVIDKLEHLLLLPHLLKEILEELDQDQIVQMYQLAAVGVLEVLVEMAAPLQLQQQREDWVVLVFKFHQLSIIHLLNQVQQDLVVV
jgi:Na+-transporting methylmalonyl-CoA/oxaloacetate decarboxylase beta subunit